MEKTFLQAVANPDATVFQGEAQTVGEVQPKNNIITFIYSINHILNDEQIKDFLNFAKINYDGINIIPIIINEKKVSVNVNVYNDNMLVCQIISLHSIDIDSQNILADIPADKQVDYINDLANTITNNIKHLYPVVNYFYYGGQSTMAMYLNSKINNTFINVKCIEPTNNRVSVDKPDGTKVSIFKHCIWRNIFLESNQNINLN